MANTKLSQLTAATSLSDDDVLYVVDAPGTTPVSKKITYGNFRAPLCTLTGSETLTNKTITAPIISTISNTGTLTLPTSTDTLVGRDTTDTLTNKTLTAPTMTTPTLGVATATSINKVTITAPATASTLTIANGKTLTASDTTTLATNAITLGGGEVITFSATNALSLLTTGSTVMTFPAATDTVATIAATQTFTNKTITKRVVTTTDDATSVINCTTTDVYELSAVANATEFSITGTPVDGQTIIIRFKDAGVAKALTWTGITALGVTLPTTTVAGKWHYVGIAYNLAATAWHALAVIQEA